MSNYVARDYGEASEDFILDNKKCALWLDMGLGKTAITLSAIKKLIWSGEVKRVLVVAPVRVCRMVWPQEISKWKEFRSLTHRLIRGTPKWRLRLTYGEEHIHIINFDLLEWLIAKRGKNWPYDMVVFDESSRLKNADTNRFKAVKKIVGEFNRVVQLTGTPAPNGLRNLWSQAYVLDGGRRLGDSFDAFKQRWFYSGSEYDRTIVPRENAQAEIEQKMSDVCLSIRASDYLDLPELVHNVIYTPMPDECVEEYARLEDEMFLEFEHAEETVEAVNAAVLSGKCWQYANGAMYLDPEEPGVRIASKDRKWIKRHDVKLDALEEVLEEASGMPLLVGYWFQSDLARIKTRFKDKAKVLDKNPHTIDKFNDGKIQMLLAHPESAGHGLNLQDGSNIVVFFSLTWSLELYQQLIERVGPVRQLQSGHPRPVHVHHIATPGTTDEVMLERLETNASVQDLLRERMKLRKQNARRAA